MNNSSAPTSGTATAADAKIPATTYSPIPAKDAVTVQTPPVQTPAKGNDEVMSTPAKQS
jgi:hypothetical protein